MPRSISTKGQPEPTFYIDENLGRTFTSLLRASGLRAQFALDLFEPGTADIVWLPYIANHSLTAITKDKLDVPKEQAAVLEHGAKVFVLTGRAPLSEWAALFLKRQKRVRSLIASHEGAFVARIYFDEGIRIIPPEEILSRLSRYRDYR